MDPKDKAETDKAECCRSTEFNLLHCPGYSLPDGGVPMLISPTPISPELDSPA